MTPLELSELAQRQQEKEERQDWRAALVAWAVLVPWSKKKLSIEDFMPRRRVKQKSGPELLAKVEILNTLLGGNDLRKKNG